MNIYFSSPDCGPSLNKISFLLFYGKLHLVPSKDQLVTNSPQTLEDDNHHNLLFHIFLSTGWEVLCWLCLLSKCLHWAGRSHMVPPVSGSVYCCQPVCLCFLQQSFYPALARLTWWYHASKRGQRRKLQDLLSPRLQRSHITSSTFS